MNGVSPAGASVLYAVDGRGEEIPILMLLGADDRLAETACKTVGTLLNKPAVCAGPFGTACVCFDPESIANAQSEAR